MLSRLYTRRTADFLVVAKWKFVVFSLFHFSRFVFVWASNIFLSCFFLFINGNNGKWKKRSWNRRNEYERGRNSPSFELDAHYYMVYLIFLLWQHTQQKKKRCAIHETWTTRTVVCYRRNLSRSVIGGGDRGRLFLRRRWLGTSKRFNCPRFSKSTTSLFHSRMSLSLFPLLNVFLLTKRIF